MKRFLRAVRTPFLCILCLAVALFACLYPLRGASEEEAEAWPGVLRLWQIDSFEGGRGSRASFLGGVARHYESEGGMLILVTQHTAESAAYALQDGQTPDLISYGPGFELATEIARPVPDHSFAAGTLGGETYAVPWCRGGYFLLTGDGDFSDISAENTVLSAGRGASVKAAAVLEGWGGDFAVQDSQQAYLSLIGGKYRYMVGSQRDVWRLRTRQFSFTAKPLTAYSDLLQYISVCSEDARRYAAALSFLELLLSQEIQQTLTKIGMMSIQYSIYADDSVFSAAERECARATVPAFMSAAARAEMDACAESALKGDKSGVKKLENFLTEYCKKSSFAV